MFRRVIRTGLVVFFVAAHVVACSGGSSNDDDGDPSDNGGTPFTPDECQQYAACDVDTTCSSGTCLVVDGCDGAICIDSDAACKRLCGSSECLMLESYPGQIQCVNSEVAPARTCADVKAEYDAELAKVQACTSADECGQIIEGTSCGCTRAPVANNGADLSTLQQLQQEKIDGELCLAVPGGTCDCPEADGFACVEGSCTWNYTQ